jgi:OOP family OmpA-OmpF porin
MSLGKALMAVAAAAVLAGCTTGFNIQSLKDAQPSGDPFNRELVRQYQDITEFEADDMYDWRDADYFARKGLKAQNGETVLPERLEDWNIPEAHVDELSDARADLMAALNNTARTKAPTAAARAQGRFDCWMEQQEENRQPEDIAACRESFYSALEELEAAMRPEPEQVEAEPEPAPQPEPEPEVPDSVTLFFDFDVATMRPNGISKVEQIAQAVEANPELEVSVTGHADRAGPADYNQELSLRRAQNVRDALTAQGVSQDEISIAARGESQPAVETGDGVREQRNRRVVVTLQ